MSGNSNKSTSYNPVSKEQTKGSAKHYGVYIGAVVSANDIRRTGRLAVRITQLNKDPDEYFVCTMASPFAGVTAPYNLGDDEKNFYQTQTSYGFWGVPPDPGNLVLVVFAEGNLSYPYVIGCLHNDRYHNMVPGMPAGTSFGDPAMLAPTAEKNKKSGDNSHDNGIRPIQIDLTESIVKQGLINDPLRGAGTSGSRRETPSEVFGLLTPGALDPKDQTYKSRLSGHHLVMDDNVGQRGIRLRSGKGSQILLNDVTNTIYMINKNGDCWFEMDALGNMYLYAENSLNLRTNGNYNVRADGDINMESGGNFNIKAAGDMREDQYVGGAFQEGLGALGLPPAGTGGSVNITAKRDVNTIADQNAKLTAGGGDIDVNAANAVKIQASGTDPVSQSAINLTALGAGGINAVATTGINLTSTSQVQIVAPDVYVGGGIVRLNTGVAVPKSPAMAISASRLNGSPKPDVSKKPPEFDREAGIKGESAIPNAGQRPETLLPKYSIVTTLVTPEPFVGHAKYDPAAFASSPGYLERFSDQGGQAFTNDSGESVSSLFDDPTGSGVNFAGAGDLAGITEQLSELSNQADTFAAAANASLMDATAFAGYIESIKSVIPPIRMPVINAQGGFMAGLQDNISKLSAELNKFQVKFDGALADLQNELGISDSLLNDIQGIAEKVANGEVPSFAEGLSLAGLELDTSFSPTLAISDGKNTVFDFSNGLSDAAAGALKGANLNTAWNEISNSFPDLPTNGGMATALSDFASDLGGDTFRSSNVYNTLQASQKLAASGDQAGAIKILNDIPQQMKGWVLTDQGTGTKTFNQALNDRRDAQIQLFLSNPEGIASMVGSSARYAIGENTFNQIAVDLHAGNVTT